MLVSISSLSGLIFRLSKVLLQTRNDTPFADKSLTEALNSRPLLSFASCNKKSMPGPWVTTTIFTLGSAVRWF